ncbi:hypothetical protein D5S19_16055 [Amycolatopsis panacis]|uniref:Uncharacterized protein n=1 Tax=Amycolatopsis panacis TaxID=2340917 RepID=A0A419I3N3_9PSEU|nr:hypothetical protein D5S19_16055 [Amycolatopsis panacis]
MRDWPENVVRSGSAASRISGRFPRAALPQSPQAVEKSRAAVLGRRTHLEDRSEAIRLVGHEPDGLG